MMSIYETHEWNIYVITENIIKYFIYYIFRYVYWLTTLSIIMAFTVG